MSKKTGYADIPVAEIKLTGKEVSGNKVTKEKDKIKHEGCSVGQSFLMQTGAGN